MHLKKSDIELFRGEVVKIVLVMLVVILIGGCSVRGEYSILNSWQGEHIDKVLLNWGTPINKTTLTNGTLMYEWITQQTNKQTTGYERIVGNTVYINTITTDAVWSCKRTLITNKHNIIITGTSVGNNCCVLAIAGQCADLLNQP